MRTRWSAFFIALFMVVAPLSIVRAESRFDLVALIRAIAASLPARGEALGHVLSSDLVSNRALQGWYVSPMNYQTSDGYNVRVTFVTAPTSTPVPVIVRATLSVAPPECAHGAEFRRKLTESAGWEWGTGRTQGVYIARPEGRFVSTTMAGPNSSCLTGIVIDENRMIRLGRPMQPHEFRRSAPRSSAGH